jgi:hypothetical protein
MLSARTIYGEIFDNDEAFGLLAAVFEVAGTSVPWDSTHIVACCFGADPAVKPC